MSDKREESKPEVTFEAQPEAVDRTEAMEAMSDIDFAFTADCIKSLADKMAGPASTESEIDETEEGDEIEEAGEADETKPHENAMFKAYFENRTLSEKATAILMLECLGHRDRAIDAVIQRVYREWSDEIIETAEKLLCHADELDAADEPAAVIMAAGVLAGNNEW